jgi:SsrA-binding protein
MPMPEMHIRQYTGYSGAMTVVENKRVGFDYTILEEMEAGLELFGFEVKSLRAGRGSLKGARVVARGGEAYLVGASIPPWQQANAPKSYDPERTRRLLLNQKEIARVAAAEGEKGLTIVPLKVYNKNRHLKLLIAVARGKKKEDKRHSIRAREEKRRIERTLKTE